MIVAAETHDEKQAVVAYIADRLGASPEDMVGAMPFEVVATMSRDGRLKGAVLYTNYRSDCIEMTCAGEPGWLTRDAVKAFFAYPFVQLGCRRVSALAARNNKASRALAEKLGFKLEGVIRQGFTTGDAMLYGLLKTECRWL